MNNIHGFGLGIATENNRGEILEVFYPRPLGTTSGENAELLAGIEGNLDKAQIKEVTHTLDRVGENSLAKISKQLTGTSRRVVAVCLRENRPPKSVAEAYLKLHLLSHRLVEPHGTDLSGLFELLPNVAWTDVGAVDLNELSERQLDARLRGKVLEVASIDKFPKMTNYVVPKGVRIAHSARVRLGAFLGEGTTVMHEGFVNFNSGSEGPGMIEGRISAGVWVQAGSDLGGGCSTMGTLSGGGNIVISVGRECLIGANAGIGIPLGNRCTIEAGLFVTAGTKVNLLDRLGQIVEIVSARSLSGRSDLLFRRHSSTGAVECLTNKSSIELNKMLHAHN